MRAAAIALLFLLLGVLASEPVLARKGFGQSGGRPTASGRVQSSPPSGSPRPHASGHHRPGHGHGHHHHGFVGVGVGFGYPWWGWYPPSYYYPYYPVGYPAQPVSYIEQGRAPVAVQPAGWWYYCDASTSYYPYVRECPAGWPRVPASPYPD